MLARSGPARAQIGQLLSPGPLSRAHASLEGADKCQKCHEPGRKVTADLCLSCHKPVAERIRQKKGVHRDVTGDCASCHVEHAGVDAELRPFDPKRSTTQPRPGSPSTAGMRRSRETAPSATRRGRSSRLTPACSTCHADVHKPSLGLRLPRVPLDGRAVQGRALAVRPLEGRVPADRRPPQRGVREVPREPGVQGPEVRAVHRLPQEPAPPADGQRVHVVPHERLVEDAASRSRGAPRFPLRGKHADVACAKCHTRPPLQATLQVRPLRDCHQDPHRGAFKQDCSSCHNETGFGRGTFDHATARGSR